VTFPRYIIVELDSVDYPFGAATVIGYCEELTDFQPISNLRVWFDDSPVAIRVGDRVRFGVRHLERLRCAA
jgi:hypothetical protein